MLKIPTRAQRRPLLKRTLCSACADLPFHEQFQSCVHQSPGQVFARAVYSFHRPRYLLWSPSFPALMCISLPGVYHHAFIQASPRLALCAIIPLRILASNSRKALVLLSTPPSHTRIYLHLNASRRSAPPLAPHRPHAPSSRNDDPRHHHHSPTTSPLH